MEDIKDKYYRFLFENTMDAIMLTRPDGSILKANPAACELFLRTEQEIQALGRFGLVGQRDPNLPLLLEERQRKGKASGHLTFLRKDGSVFVAQITSALFQDEQGETWSAMILRDISTFLDSEKKLKSAIDEAELMASCDALTGLLNRRAFDQKIRPLLENAILHKQPFSLILIDMDHFKEINDQWGHLIGDYVLRQVAQLMTLSLRPQDLLARLGGDELIIALPDTPLDIAVAIAERLRHLLNRLHKDVPNIPLPLRASFGVSDIQEGDPCPYEGLYQRADAAMYQAKIHRNKVVG